MKVQLKVLSGSGAGKVIPLARPRFVIGRAENCDLRPNSDSVSREHCAITVEQFQANVRDLGSRNGTYVNGKKIQGTQILQSGDQLAVGPLQFEVVIANDVKEAKRGKGQAAGSGHAKAAADTSGNQWLDDDGETISQWLDEADAVDREQRLTDPDTRVFKFDETDRVAIDSAEKATSNKGPGAGKKKSVPKKKPPAKLPPEKVDPTKDTQEAAAKMLRRLFNRS